MSSSPSNSPGKCTVMMGSNERRFEPPPREISLEDLVPKDNFYRRLEKTLELSFVRELVRPLYARWGRPWVDPVVFFRLPLVMGTLPTPSEMLVVVDYPAEDNYPIQA